MEGRSRVAACLALVAVGAGTAEAAASEGVALTQRDLVGQTVLTLGDDGAKLLLTGEGSATPTFGMVLQYRRQRMISFDPLRRVYVDLSFNEALARARALRRAEYPTTPLPDGIARPRRPSGRAGLRTFETLTDVRGIKGRVSELIAAGETVRVTYGVGLPPIPAVLRSGLADSALRSGPFDNALAGRLGGVPVRVEVKDGGRFVRTLDTSRMRAVTLTAADFNTPRGYRRVNATDFFGVGSATTSASANVVHINPAGPVSSHPRVTDLLWGAFTGDAGQALRGFLNSAVEESLRKPYGGALSQYGIRRLPGKRTRSHVRSSNPPASVGGTGAAGPARVISFIGAQQLKGRAPAYWICCDRDPMIFIFVIKEDVASAPWDGYHFWSPTIGSLLPWPLSMVVYRGVPYTLVKVPRAARNGTGSAKTTARNLATGTLSHEFVEAATDPFPLFGWLDPTKTPLWTKSEISDICHDDAHGSVTVNGFNFSTYWSNRDNRCMP